MQKNLSLNVTISLSTFNEKTKELENIINSITNENNLNIILK